MSHRGFGLRFSVAAASVALVALGVGGLLKPRQVIGASTGSAISGADTSMRVLSHLRLQELTLNQRRDAVLLLHDFTRAQMTRHYWGSFADSLLDLGLASPDEAMATVQSGNGGSKLWIVPRRGREAYLAVVERHDARLLAYHCKGDRNEVMKSFNGDCPDAWTRYTTPEPTR